MLRRLRHVNNWLKARNEHVNTDPQQLTAVLAVSYEVLDIVLRQAKTHSLHLNT